MNGTRRHSARLNFDGVPLERRIPAAFRPLSARRLLTLYLRMWLHSIGKNRPTRRREIVARAMPYLGPSDRAERSWTDLRNRIDATSSAFSFGPAEWQRLVLLNVSPRDHRSLFG
jgi:hypothetical protein